jgi:hypothetical protein
MGAARPRRDRGPQTRAALARGPSGRSKRRRRPRVEVLLTGSSRWRSRTTPSSGDPRLDRSARLRDGGGLVLGVPEGGRSLSVPFRSGCPGRATSSAASPSTSIPTSPTPASHGCVPTPRYDARWLYDFTPIGRPYRSCFARESCSHGRALAWSAASGAAPPATVRAVAFSPKTGVLWLGRTRSRTITLVVPRWRRAEAREAASVRGAAVAWARGHRRPAQKDLREIDF